MYPFNHSDNQIKKFQNHTYTWSELHKHYSNIKSQHNLISSDIFKQLSFNYTNAHLQYLSSHGIHRNPSNKPGTIGKSVRDILCSNVLKTDWTPSTATYQDKLIDLMLEGCFTTYAYIVNTDSDQTPEINVMINLDQEFALNEEQLKQLYTIDGIIPKIKEIIYTRYL